MTLLRAGARPPGLSMPALADSRQSGETDMHKGRRVSDPLALPVRGANPVQRTNDFRALRAAAARLSESPRKINVVRKKSAERPAKPSDSEELVSFRQIALFHIVRTYNKCIVDSRRADRLTPRRSRPAAGDSTRATVKGAEASVPLSPLPRRARDEVGERISLIIDRRARPADIAHLGGARPACSR